MYVCVCVCMCVCNTTGLSQTVGAVLLPCTCSVLCKIGEHGLVPRRSCHPGRCECLGTRLRRTCKQAAVIREATCTAAQM